MHATTRLSSLVLILALSQLVEPFPIFLMRISSYVVHRKWFAKTQVGFHRCSTQCKTAGQCRGFTYNNITQQCQMVTFYEYNFVPPTQPPNDQIYLRQFTFWNETNYNFQMKCPAFGRTTDYIQRLKELKLTRCLANIPVYTNSNLLTKRKGFVYRVNSRVELSCDSSYRNYCYHQCPSGTVLVVEYRPGFWTFMENLVIWPAICYNNEWTYFDAVSQLVYPVVSWNCAERRRIVELTTRKMGRFAQGTHLYKKTLAERPAKAKAEDPEYCYVVGKVPGCDLVSFGSANGGKQLTRNTTLRNFIHYGYCAIQKGTCNAKVEIVEYSVFKDFQYVTRDGKPKQGKLGKFACHFWGTVQKQCKPGINSALFKYVFDVKY